MTLKEFWDSKEIIAIHCDTETKANALLNRFNEMGKSWVTGISYMAHNNYETYEEKTCYTNRGAFGCIKHFKENNIKVIEFDEIEDFKFKCENNYKFSLKFNLSDNYRNELLNSLTEDMKKYPTKLSYDKTDFEDLGEKLKLFSPKLHYNFFTINRKKKTIFLKRGEKHTTIKCDENDKFDWEIGLGLALSKLNAISREKAKWHREYFRNKKTHKLNYKKYANWVLIEFYNNNYEDIENLKNRVNKTEDNVQIYL